MEASAQAYERLAERFSAWAQGEEDIRAVIVVGSRARTDHPADEWSDLDIGVVTTNPRRYCESSDWLQHVGAVWLTFVEPTADGRSMERRVLFEGGLDVDFASLPADMFHQMAAMGMPADIADVVRRGVRILVDKDGLAASLQPPSLEPPLPEPPSQADFDEVVHDFWYHAVWTAKHLRRGELWWAKSGCDNSLKERLRRMMEWHARAVQGQAHDTWLRGRFLEEWADARAVAGLREAFAHYDGEDIWRALFVTMDLFRWLAMETAERLGLAYPMLGDERATTLVKQLFAGRA